MQITALKDFHSDEFNRDFEAGKTYQIPDDEQHVLYTEVAPQWVADGKIAGERVKATITATDD